MSHVVRTHFIAPKELIEETDRLVGSRRRSQFITEAVTEKLKREKLVQLSRQAAKLPSVEGIADWASPEAISRWVHDGRVESDSKRNV